MNKSISLIPLLSLFLSACAAHHGAANIYSEPSGAEVVDVKSGVLLGVTPFTSWWRDDSVSRKFVNIRVQKEGYRDKTNSFWVTLRHDSRESAVENAQTVEMTLDKVK
jgi:hypothetical protein